MECHPKGFSGLASNCEIMPPTDENSTFSNLNGPEKMQLCYEAYKEGQQEIGGASAAFAVGGSALRLGVVVLRCNRQKVKFAPC